MTFEGEKESSAKNREAEFFALAARIFGVDAAELSAGTRRGDIAGWDSVNHIRLVMEAEKFLGVVYPIERIPALETLGDFLR